MHLGHTLRQFRLRAGLNQSEMAELLGVTQSHVSKIETGTITTTAILVAWVQHCGGELRLELEADRGREIVELSQTLERAVPVMSDEQRQVLRQLLNAWKL